MTKELVIRPAELNDIKGIRQVAGITWHNTYGSMYSEEFITSFLDQAYSADNLEKSITRDTTNSIRKFMVADLNGMLAGYAQLTATDNGVCELSRIYVLPGYQGKGIGRSLLNELIVNDNSIEKVFAWVEKENAVGVQFYQSNDFLFEEEMEETMNGQTTILHKYNKQL